MDELMTVTGPVPAGELGIILPHEHIMSIFGGEARRYPDYPVERLMRQVLPYLAMLKDLGITAIADCTAAYFGRHPELLRQISQESGIKILTTTGYYSARKARYVPAHAFEESAAQIADRWVREWEDSIDATGIRPGLIKISVEEEPMPEIELRLIDAAIQTHLRTGLPIEMHTGDYPQAAELMMDRMEQAGAPVEAWVWVHAHAQQDIQPLLAAAKRGAWISLDGISKDQEDSILSQLNALRAAGYLSQVVLSHDGEGFTLTGGLRPFDYLLTGFTQKMKTQGWGQDEIDLLTSRNPARMLRVRAQP